MQLYISVMKFKVPLIISLAVASFASCQKEDLPPAVKPQASLNVINLTSTSVNVLQNGNRINNTSTVYPNGVTGYLVVSAGESPFTITRNGTPDIFFTKQLALDSLGEHTLFIAGATADDAILTNDRFTTDTANVTQVRLVQASSKAGDLEVRFNDTVAFSNAAYKSVSDFKKLKPGNKELKILRGTTVLLTDSVTITRNNAYTLYTSGDPQVTGDAGFGAGILQL